MRCGQALSGGRLGLPLPGHLVNKCKEQRGVCLIIILVIILIDHLIFRALFQTREA